MPPTETPFEQFFSDRIKTKGISLKKLSDLTGIAPTHIESLLRGDFDSLPSAPYLHGYLLRLGAMLDFDGEEWWIRLKQEGVIKNSGELDMLPKNRFIKKSPPKYLWAIAVAVVVLIYFAFQAPRIFGKPSLVVTFPIGNPYATASSTLTITGTISDADSLTLNGDQVTINSDGTWQKGVLLQNGLNTFQVAAKKFLGGETDVVEQVLYSQPGAPAATTTASTTTSTTLPLGSTTLPSSTK
jgi:hypothetical protein